MNTQTAHNPDPGRAPPVQEIRLGAIRAAIEVPGNAVEPRHGVGLGLEEGGDLVGHLDQFSRVHALRAFPGAGSGRQQGGQLPVSVQSRKPNRLEPRRHDGPVPSQGSPSRLRPPCEAGPVPVGGMGTARMTGHVLADPDTEIGQAQFDPDAVAASREEVSGAPGVG